jgi:hypothetical protein
VCESHRASNTEAPRPIGGALCTRLSSNVADSPILLIRNETNVFAAVAYIWDTGK